MLTINKSNEGEALVIALVGELDTNTAVDFNKVIDESLSGVTKLIIDIAELEYISSSGLRSFMSAYKIMRTQGEMKIRNTTPKIAEIFSVTGFDGFLDFE